MNTRREFGQPKRRGPIARPTSVHVRPVYVAKVQDVAEVLGQEDTRMTVAVAETYGHLALTEKRTPPRLQDDVGGRAWSPSQTDKVEQALALAMADKPGAERMTDAQWDAFCEKQIAQAKEKARKQRKGMQGNGLVA